MPTNINGTTGVDKIQDGSVHDVDIDSVSASKLTGALPAIDGSALTGLPDAGTGPTFRAYMSTNLTLATGVQTKVPLNTEEWDTNSNYDNATNYRFTPTVAGYYIFTGAAFGAISTTARFGVSVRKNGGNASWDFNNGLTSDGGGSVVVSTILYANGSSDYFELYLLQNQGTNATIVNSNENTWFSGSLIRSA